MEQAARTHGHGDGRTLAAYALKGHGSHHRRRHRHVALGLVLVALGALLSGCLGGEDTPAPITAPDEPPEVAENVTSPYAPKQVMTLETDLGALVDIENATGDDWFLLVGASGPEGNVTGFSWTVPDGAVIDRYRSPWCATCRPASTLHLEVAPVVPDGADRDGISQYILAVFVDDGEAVSLLTYQARGWFAERSLYVAEATYDHADLSPYFFRLGFDSVSAGDTIYFVLIAESEDENELGMAFRALPKDRGCFIGPPIDDCGPVLAPDFDAFRSARDTEQPYALPRTGQGVGYSFPSFYDSNYYGIQYSGWTRDVQYAWGLPEATRHGGLLDLTLSFDFPSERGWGAGVAHVLLTATGEWSYEYNIHGSDAEASSVAVAGCGRPPLDCPFGLDLSGNGEGPSAASLHVRTVDPVPFREVWFEHIDFAVTLEDLLGIPGEDAGVSEEATANVLRQRAETLGGPWIDLHARFVRGAAGAPGAD